MSTTKRQLSRQRLEFAMYGFLAEMRRQWISRNPDKPCPVKVPEHYSDADRSALMAGIAKAIQYSDPSTDAAFETWTEKRSTENSSQP